MLTETQAHEAPLSLSLSMADHTGHTEMLFEKDQVTVKWAETNAAERDLIKSLVKTCKLFGFTAWTVGADGRAHEPLTTLPGLMRGKKGELILKGEIKRIKMFAQEMIDGEIRDGKMVFECQKDGTWKQLREKGALNVEQTAKAQEAEKTVEKKEVVSSAKVGGG